VSPRTNLYVLVRINTFAAARNQNLVMQSIASYTVDKGILTHDKTVQDKTAPVRTQRVKLVHTSN
jgi:hypothetical protein